MKRPPRPLLLLSVALLLSSCLPEERVWWSPKGDQALVSISSQLHVVKADGNLGAPLAEGQAGAGAAVRAVSWLPDGSGFVCHRERTFKSWNEARAAIPEDEAKAVEQLTPAIAPLLQAASALSQGADSLEGITSDLSIVQQRRFSAALLRKYQEDPEATTKLLLTLPDGKGFVEGLQKGDSGYVVSELCLFKVTPEGQGTLVKPLQTSLINSVWAPKVSPKHDMLAFVRLDEKGDTAGLELMPLNGGPARVVVQKFAGAFDWMPDGRTLVFMAPFADKDEKLQGIHRLTVLREDGTLIKADDKDGSEDDAATLATAIMLNRLVLQALPDGRVLFASLPASLPLSNAITNLSPKLFVIAADGKSVQQVPTAPGDLPTDLGYFTASPDGRQVAVVESETDAVAVVDLATGKTRVISAPHPNWHCETMPAWKSATELTYVALQGAANEPKLMLWTEEGGPRCISEKWPAAATKDWLSYKEPAKDNPTEGGKPGSP